MKKQEIILPISKNLLVKELNESRFIRHTNFANNEIYVVTAEDSPNVLLEIGRLREITFREAGGGTGRSLDIDEYDYFYRQLIVWDPKMQEIVGGYRYIKCSDAPKNEKGEYQLATSHLFGFSNKFINDYLPYTIELGRSFVQPEYQPSNEQTRRGVFSLDNIWDGLGAIVVDNPDIKYFFGKVTMYLNFDQRARDLILFFIRKYFLDKEKIVLPHQPVRINTEESELENIFCGKNYKEDYIILKQKVREFNENIPPLINSYMNLSPSMLTFGTSANDTFGEVEETGILVTIADIYDAKKERHLLTYKKGDK